jgi:uncharacterized protein (DUF2147 family)
MKKKVCFLGVFIICIFIFLFGKHSGTFTDSGQNVGNSNSAGIALGDLDGDGDVDAFVSNASNQPNKVWMNDGNGYFTDSGQNLGNLPGERIALGDLDGDGDLDAFVPNYYDQPNKVWLNDGNGNFTDSGQNLGSSRSGQGALGDLDGDGDLDAFVGNYSDQPNKVWLNDGNANFTDSGQSLGSSGSLTVSLGDLDGDGDLDAFVGNGYGGSNKVWLNDGSGNFTDSGQNLGNSTTWGLALGDLDGDGDLDAFTANHSSLPNKVWLNDGNAIFVDSGQNLGNFSSFDVKLGDLDSDGDLDAFVGNAEQPNRVWLNDGSGNFTDSGQDLGNSQSYQLALGDLDMDGDLDAFVGNGENQPNKVWFNNAVPGNITLSNSSVVENQPVGTEVGTFSTSDFDIEDIHTYTLVAGTGDDDNGSFTIDGNILRINEVFDYITKKNYSVRVRTDDSHGGYFEKQFGITVIRTDDIFIPNGIGEDYGKAIIQTSDGGYIFIGYTNSFANGGYDILLYKLDSSGNKQWRKNFGGINDDFAISVQQTTDGGYIVAGFGDSFTHGGMDFLVYKLDGSGNKQWRRNYGGADSEKAFSIKQTLDGGYIVIGYTSTFVYGSDVDFLVYKLDSSGNKQWRRNFGGIGNDYGTVVIQTLDEGYLFMGDTDSYGHGVGDYDILLYSIDKYGNEKWQKNFGGLGDEYTWDYWAGDSSIVQTSDGGFIFCSMSGSFTHGGIDFLLYKLDANGNKQWRKNYGGTFNDEAYSIVQTSDGGYIVAGTTESFTHGGIDFLLYKLDTNGTKQWRRNFGGLADDYAFSIKQTSDGGYIVAGTTMTFVHTADKPDFLVYKLSANGIKQWRKNFGM